MSLKIEGLKKSFSGSGAILKGINLSIKRGAFESVMGASGSGKSTLLHIVAGLITPDAGTVTIGESEISAMNDTQATCFRRRNIGLIFQDFNLIPSLSVEENITLPLLLGRQRVIRAELDALIERFGLVERRYALPEKLSGGERQRCAIARALITKPLLILADEPTGNLDSVAGKEFCELLTELNAVEQCTILLISHDPLVAAYSRTVHLLHDGLMQDHFATENNAELVSRRSLALTRKSVYDS